MKIKNIFRHFFKICTHKYYVARYCFHFRLFRRGIMHDLSKFSPIEFWESVKYYAGNDSPINISKKINGYSKAWQHHKGRNTHHYEYWVDDLDHGGKPLLMPFADAVEMICDYLGAAKAYMGKDFTYQKELEWWKKKNSDCIQMHPVIKEFITQVFKDLTVAEKYRDTHINEWFNRDYLTVKYMKAVRKYANH